MHVNTCTYINILIRAYICSCRSVCTCHFICHLTLPRIFSITLTLLIVLLQCCVLWCCIFITGQLLALIKQMKWTIIMFQRVHHGAEAVDILGHCSGLFELCQSRMQWCDMSRCRQRNATVQNKSIHSSLKSRYHCWLFPSSFRFHNRYITSWI